MNLRGVHLYLKDDAGMFYRRGRVVDRLVHNPSRPEKACPEVPESKEETARSWRYILFPHKTDTCG